MIPASYLFKNTYFDAWERPAPAPEPAPRRESDGLLRPLISAVRALVRHRRAPSPTFHRI